MFRPSGRRTISQHPRGTQHGGGTTPFWASPVFMLSLGLVTGGMLTYLLLLPLQTDVHVVTTTTTPPALRTPVPTKRSSPGWHPIHVFYGKPEGLQLDPTKEWFAQVHQDEIVVDLLGENGYFIDLAANDAKELSNTVALEKHGWTGLCVEPNPAYWYGLSHRKCTVVGALVGGPQVEKVPVKFRGVFGGILGRMDEKLANRKREPDAMQEERYTAPFAELLQEYNVPRTIDYLSLDVEGAEYLIMQHFPFDKYTIKILTIERPSNELKTLLEEHGYIMLKSLAWWGETLWAHKSTGFTSSHAKIVKIPTEERK